MLMEQVIFMLFKNGKERERVKDQNSIISHTFIHTNRQHEKIVFEKKIYAFNLISFFTK